MELKPVKVTWIDSIISSRWDTIEDFSSKSIKCMYIESIGYLAKKTKYSVIIAQSYDGNGNFSNYSEIPRCAIIKIKKVKI
jgi:hypothetical protein